MVVGLLGVALVVLVGVTSACAALFATLPVRRGPDRGRPRGGRETLLWRPAAALTVWASRRELARVGRSTEVRLPAPAGMGVPHGKDWASRVALPDGARRLLYWVLRAPVSLLQVVAFAVGFVVPVRALVGSVGLLAGDARVTVSAQVMGNELPPAYAWMVTVVSALVLVASCLLLPRWFASLDVALARVLLARTGIEVLESSVTRLRTSRAQAVGSAQAERERIERDLHDGAQQRLVALSMLLGRAQARLSADADPTLERLLREARAETTSAIGEIRDLTRGLHPPVLTDRGLDAALSAVAARMSLPVDIGVDLPQRPSPTTEAVVYFAMTEALTNVAKHARAAHAWVRIERVEASSGPLVRAVVLDDGVGGADPNLGSGLRGLRDRLAGVDGGLSVSSPVGGPTEIVVEVPCAS